MKAIRLVGNVLYWASFFLMMIALTWLYEGESMAYAFIVMSIMLAGMGYALRASSPNPHQFTAMRFWMVSREMQKEKK